MSVVQSITLTLDFKTRNDILKRQIQESILAELSRPQYDNLSTLAVCEALSELREMLSANNLCCEKLSALVPA